MSHFAVCTVLLNFKHTHTKYPKWSHESDGVEGTHILLPCLRNCCVAKNLFQLHLLNSRPRDLIWALSELVWFRATGT